VAGSTGAWPAPVVTATGLTLAAYWSGWYAARSRSYSAAVTGSTVPCRGRLGRL
jgi:hypothetical protein